MKKTLDIDQVKRNVLRSVHATEPLTQTQANALDEAVQESLSSYAVPDTSVYRIAVYALAIAVLISVCSAVVLAAKSQTIPDIISVVSGAAIGALAGMLRQN